MSQTMLSLKNPAKKARFILKEKFLFAIVMLFSLSLVIFKLLATLKDKLHLNDWSNKIYDVLHVQEII